MDMGDLLRAPRFWNQWITEAEVIPGLGAGATSWVRITCMNSAGFVFHFMAS